MLAELADHISHTPDSEDAKSAAVTREYLDACHHIFERGILNSNISLHKPDSFIIKQMEGQKFLTAWLDELLSTGSTFSPLTQTTLTSANAFSGYEPTPATQKSFLSWQVLHL